MHTERNLFAVLSLTALLTFPVGAQASASGFGGQTDTQAQTTQAPVSPAQKRKARQRRVASTPASSPAPAVTPTSSDQQKQADQQLLQQQQARSAAEQQINNQLVHQRSAAESQSANEIRIQDAPGPAQTGTVPGVPVQALPPNQVPRIQDAPGPATAPVQNQPGNTQRIQDAPGPAQTIPTIPPQPAQTQQLPPQ